MHTHAHTHPLARTHAHARMHTHAHTHTYAFTHALMHARPHAYAPTRMRTCRHTDIPSRCDSKRVRILKPDGKPSERAPQFRCSTMKPGIRCTGLVHRFCVRSCQQGRRRMAKLAMRYNCNLDAQNHNGHTALHYCFQYQRELRDGMGPLSQPLERLLAITLALEGFRFPTVPSNRYRLLPPRLGRQRCHVEGCRPHSNCIASWLSISFQKARIQRCATSLDAPQPMVSGKLTYHRHCQARIRPCRLPAGPRGRIASRHVASAWSASASQRLLTHYLSCLLADVHFEVGILNL